MDLSLIHELEHYMSSPFGSKERRFHITVQAGLRVDKQILVSVSSDHKKQQKFTK